MCLLYESEDWTSIHETLIRVWIQSHMDTSFQVELRARTAGCTQLNQSAVQIWRDADIYMSRYRQESWNAAFR